MSFCPACRKEMAEEGRYCGFCGFDLTPMDPIPLTRRKGPSGEGPIPLVKKKTPSAAREQATREGDGPSEGRNLRETKRHPLKVDVTYFSEHNFFTGFSENISSGGIFVATYDTPQLGQVFDVLFTIPGLQEPTRARGRVVWVREHDPLNPDSIAGMGLRFEDLEPAVEDAVNLFLAHRDPIFYED